MASKPANTQMVPEEELPLTSINDRLVNLPDESVIDVELAGGTEEPEVKKSDDKTTPPPSVETTEESETLAALRKQIEDNNKANQERLLHAERLAEHERQARLQSEQSFREREQATAEEVSQRELALITHGIETAQGQLDSLEAELARLNEAGEFKEAAKVQGKIARAAASLDRLEADKAAFESSGGRRTPVQEGAVPSRPEPPLAPGVVFERYLSGFAPAAANWIRNHPECAAPEVGGSLQAHSKMMAGHYAAQAAGIEINSPDYFRTIEEHTGHRQKAEVEQPQRPTPSVRKPIPSAPPSREVLGTPGSQSSTRTRQVRLSKEQQEAALLSFPHLKPPEALAAYAKNLIELEAEGKMGRTSH